MTPNKSIRKGDYIQLSPETFELRNSHNSTEMKNKKKIGLIIDATGKDDLETQKSWSILESDQKDQLELTLK